MRNRSFLKRIVPVLLAVELLSLFFVSSMAVTTLRVETPATPATIAADSLPGANTVPSNCPSTPTALDFIQNSSQYGSLVATTDQSFHPLGVGYTIINSSGVISCDTFVIFGPISENAQQISEPSITAAVSIPATIGDQAAAPFLAGIALTPGTSGPLWQFSDTGNSSAAPATSYTFSCSSLPTTESCNWGGFAANSISTIWYQDVLASDIVTTTASNPSPKDTNCCGYGAWVGLGSSISGRPELAQDGYGVFLGNGLTGFKTLESCSLNPAFFYLLLTSSGGYGSECVNPESMGCSAELAAGDSVLEVTYQASYDSDSFNWLLGFSYGTNACDMNIPTISEGTAIVSNYAYIIGESPTLTQTYCSWSYGEGICQLPSYSPSFSGSATVYGCLVKTPTSCTTYNYDGSGTGTLYDITLFQGCTDNEQDSFSGQTSFNISFLSSSMIGNNNC